jgi:neutral ceramidase
MPAIDLPRELKPVISEFSKEHKLFIKSVEGKTLLIGATAFGHSLMDTATPDLVLEKNIVSAEETLDWIMRLPEKLISFDKAPLIDLQQLTEKEAMLAISAGLQVLAAGVRALIVGPMIPKDFAPDAILHAAFGADPAAVAIRKPLFDPKFHWPDSIDDLKLANIDKLVREGTLRELLQTFARCGYAAQQDREWVNRVTPIGVINSITPNRACGGQKITINYAGFGMSPPASDTVTDILISLPISNGTCDHVSIRSIIPDFFDPARWSDSGTFELTLPDNILTGCLGFFTKPPPMVDAGSCDAGSLVGAAGMFQSVLGDQFGQKGIVIGQLIYDATIKIESGRHQPLPCAVCQANNSNHLNAGPPNIFIFQVQETGAIHPRGFVTLHWSVGNADLVEIEPRAVADSENPHELPAIQGPFSLNGRIQIAIPCSRRWEGEYVLRASNANGCTTAPLESIVKLKSGYSDYRVGVAKVDITDRREGLGMAGFAWMEQKTSGRVHLPQYARAFVIEENKAAPDRKLIAIVVADIWTCTQAVKTAVVERLNALYSGNKDKFSAETVMIAGTHTHAGPGGYSEYFLYNLTVHGFDQQVFDTIVNGIVTAIAQANVNKVPGRIYVNAGELADCGANRSFEAYQRNPEFLAGAGTDQWTDRDMMLLKFVRDINNRGVTEPIGALNWYAIHATSLGMFNADISGDNKGWAEKLFEDSMQGISQNFVAAFGNGNAGDVSGNVTLDAFGNKTVIKPLGGTAANGVSLFPPLLRDPASITQDVQRMEDIGRRQFEHALLLFNSASSEVTGQIKTIYTHVDMSNVSIANQSGARTWPAALGVSFGAGSSEDSIAYATFKEGGLNIDAGIIEGMALAEMIAGSEEAIRNILPLALASLGVIPAILAGAPILPALLPTVLGIIANLVNMPYARSFLAAQVASLKFPDEVQQRPPQPPPPISSAPDISRGIWSWNPPSGSLPLDDVLGHGAKPIMFPVGYYTLSFTPGPNSDLPPINRTPCPLVPHVLPLQLLKIGNIAIAGVPAEFTSTAGRRLKNLLRTGFGGTLSHVAISNYSNAYSGYVTTPEEYNAQHYEGASTLYGPHTLAAYLQTFNTLATAMMGGMPMPVTEPFSVPAFFRKH